MNISEVRTAILTGELDDHENTLINALKERRKIRGALKKSLINPGDTVVFTNGRPKYLVGLEAEVVSVKQTRAVIRFKDPRRARKYGFGTVRAPLESLTPA